MLPVIDLLLHSLLVRKLAGKTGNRTCDLSQSALLVVLDPQVREQILHIVGFDALRGRIVEVATLVSGAFERATLLGYLLLHKLVDLSLQAVVVLDATLLFDI